MKNSLQPIRFAGIVFLIWVSAPIILFSLVYFFSSVLFTQDFVFKLLVPAVVLSIISLLIFRIKNQSIKTASIYALIGAAIWASPAMYFLPISPTYSMLQTNIKFLAIILPSALLSILFYYIGKGRSQSASDLSELYERRSLLSKSK